MIAQSTYQQLGRNLRLDAKRAVSDFTEALKAGTYRREEFSLRELAEHTVEDGREWVRTMDPRFGESAYVEAAGAVSTVNFSNITGQLALSAVMDAYENEAYIFSRLVETIPTRLSNEKIPGLQRIGNQAEVVGEAEPYPLVGIGEDWIRTPTAVKRGMIVPVTKEAIFYDLTGRVLTNCAEVGEFLGVNKEIRIIDCLIDENTTAGRYNWKDTVYATYASSGGHGVVNLKAANGLVDWTNIDAALLVASQIVDPWTGLPISAMGSDLVVAQQLVATANHVVNATSNIRTTPGFATSANPNQATLNGSPITGLPGYSAPQYNIRSSKLLSSRLATKTSWFIGDVRKQIAYWEHWPITVSQASPNSEKEFNQDIVMQFKASEKGAAGHKDVRYLVKNTVA